MKNLELSNRIAKLTNLNTRVEKHGDDDVVRADLNFVMPIRVDDLVRLAVTETTPTAIDRWAELLYQPSDGKQIQKLREHGIASIKFNREFTEHTLLLDTNKARLRFTDARLCKFSAQIDYDDHSLSLAFQAQIDPLGHLDELAEYLNRSPINHIEPPAQQDLVDTIKIKEAQDEDNEELSNVRAFPDAMDGRRP